MKPGQLTAEWSTEERLQELRGKLNLKERDNDAYFRFSQEKISENDTLIKKLRQQVRQQRELMAQCLDGDREVINTALQKTPVDILTYNRVTASKCIEEKNQDVFDQVKKLNSIQHHIRSHHDTIKELELTLTNLKAQQQKSVRQNKTTGHDTSDQRVRVLSTRLDKVLLKINSARYVNTTYKRLLSYLEKDSLSLPSRLDDLESCLEQQKHELSVLRKIHGEAKAACDSTKHERRHMEDSIMQEKSVRDQKLSKVRRSVKQLNDEADQFNINVSNNKSKGQKNQSNSGSSSSFSPEKIIQKEALAKALGMLKETVGASSIEDIATNFEQQLKRQQNLLTEAEDFQKIRERLHAELKREENAMKVSKYDASIELDHAHDPESALVNQDDTIVAQMRQLETFNESVATNVHKIKLALDVFYNKCRQVDKSLPIGEANLMAMCGAIMNTLSGIAATHKNQLMVEEPNDKDELVLVDTLPTKNVRIELPEDETEDAPAGTENAKSGARTGQGVMFDNDDDELIETSYFSRDDIKKKSTELVRMNTTKKKH